MLALCSLKTDWGNWSGDVSELLKITGGVTATIWTQASTPSSGSAVKNPLAVQVMWASIPGSGRSPGEGNGNRPQDSCLGNLMDRGAWRAIVPWGLKSIRYDLVTNQHLACTLAWAHAVKQYAYLPCSKWAY